MKINGGELESRVKEGLEYFKQRALFYLFLPFTAKFTDTQIAREDDALNREWMALHNHTHDSQEAFLLEAAQSLASAPAELKETTRDILAPSGALGQQQLNRQHREMPDELKKIHG